MVIDVESGGSDEALEDLFNNGVHPDNIYVVYTQSQKEVKDYIAKITNNDDFYDIDEDGNESDEVVLDEDGETFRPDEIVRDVTSVVKRTSQQSLVT